MLRSVNLTLPSLSPNDETVPPLTIRASRPAKNARPCPPCARSETTLNIITHETKPSRADKLMISAALIGKGHEVWKGVSLYVSTGPFSRKVSVFTVIVNILTGSFLIKIILVRRASLTGHSRPVCSGLQAPHSSSSPIRTKSRPIKGRITQSSTCSTSPPRSHIHPRHACIHNESVHKTNVHDVPL